MLSCFGKLFTSIINDRLTSYIDDLGALGCEQAGFRKNYSTNDHLFSLYSVIDILLCKKSGCIVLSLITKRHLIKLTEPFFGRNYYDKILMVNCSM